MIAYTPPIPAPPFIASIRSFATVLRFIDDGIEITQTSNDKIIKNRIISIKIKNE